MSLLESPRPSAIDVPGFAHPWECPLDDDAEGDIDPETARDIQNLLQPRGLSPLGRVLLVLAMLSSVGAGASITLAMMKDDGRYPVVAVATPETTGSISGEANRAVPHNVWAPFVNAMPSWRLNP
jgi:hypothetical protein